MLPGVIGRINLRQKLVAVSALDAVEQFCNTRIFSENESALLALADVARTQYRTAYRRDIALQDIVCEQSDFLFHL